MEAKKLPSIAPTMAPFVSVSPPRDIALTRPLEKDDACNSS